MSAAMTSAGSIQIDMRAATRQGTLGVILIVDCLKSGGESDDVVAVATGDFLLR